MRKLSLVCLLVVAFGAPSAAFVQGRGADLRPVRRLPARENRWAVIIGVDDYRDKNVTDLNGAVNDARALRDALVTYAGFPPDQVVMFTTDAKDEDRQPTRANIIAWFDNLENTVPANGLLLLAFSGHGKENEADGRVYLMPSDVKLTRKASSLEQLAIGVDFIKQQIRAARIRQVLVLLDSCRDEPQASKSGGDNLLSEGYRNNFDFDVRNREVEAFAVVYATTVGRRAYEFEDRETGRQRGFFSWALVKGLAGAAANGRGEVTLLGLIKYVEDAVPRKLKAENVAGHQRPFTDMKGYKSDELVIAVGRGAGPAATSDGRSRRDADWALVNKNSCGEIELFLRSHVGDFEATLYQSRLNCGGKGPPAPATETARNAEYYLNRGLKHYSADDYDRAIADATQAIKLAPKDESAYMLRAAAYFKKGDYDRVIIDTTEAIKLDPESSTLYSFRGRTHFEKHDYDRTIADCTEAIKLDPKNTSAYFFRGAAFFYKGDYDRAIADCTRAIDLNPKSDDAYFVRATAHMAKGALDQSIADYTEAIRLSGGKDDKYYYGRALVRSAKGDHDGAIADFTAALRLDPRYAAAYKGRGQVFYKKKNYNDAVADYTEALRLKPDFVDAYELRARCYDKLGEREKAEADRRKANDLKKRKGQAN